MSVFSVSENWAGWSGDEAAGMCFLFQKIGQVGVVTRVRPPGTVGLRLGKVVFRMNPVALLKVHQHSTGDKVLIRDDLYQLRVLNDRLGWNSGMDRVGKLCQGLSSCPVPHPSHC